MKSAVYKWTLREVQGGNSVSGSYWELLGSIEENTMENSGYSQFAQTFAIDLRNDNVWLISSLVRKLTGIHVQCICFESKSLDTYRW